MLHIGMPERMLPVLGRTDAIVIGGSFAGVSAALAFAEAGLTVFLVEQRTYPGREMTATHRYWLRPSEARRHPLTAACLPDREAGGGATPPEAQDGAGRRGDERETPLHPDEVKLQLEERLLDAGVRLLYATLPVRAERDGAGGWRVLIANKSGMQALEGRIVVDATETAVTAYGRGGEIAGALNRMEESRGAGRFARVLEFTGCSGALLAEGRELKLPARPEAAGDVVRLRRGSRGAGHLFAELMLELPAGNTASLTDAREWEARKRSMEAAAYLIGHVPGFEHAFLAGASSELYGPIPAGDADEGEAVASREADLSGDAPFVTVDGIWYASALLEPDGTGRRWFDAVPASIAGEALARAAMERLRQEKPPAELSAGFGSNPGTDARGEGSDRNPGGMAASGGEDAIGRSGGQSAIRAAGAAGRSGIAMPSGPSSRLADAEISPFGPALQDAPQAGKTYERAAAASFYIPVAERAEVLVVGGGTSGATAAVTSAREGARTMLLELNAGLGGTGTFGGVDSYWFGRKTGFAARISRLVDEQQEKLRYRGGKWNIEAKKHALLLEAESAGVETAFGAITFGALTAGNAVKGALAATRWGPAAYLADVTIDATGDGDIAAYAGAEFVYGSERDRTVMWYSLAQFEKPGRTQNNFTSMVDVSNIEDYTRAIMTGRRRGSGVYDHGEYVATRESRHIRGDVVMNLSDQLLRRLWPDVVNVHFSNHDMKGISSADWVNVGAIPPNLLIEMPYRMLLPAGLEQLLVVGKAISATHDALPAIRMQADLENLGGAAAIAAVRSLREGTTPRGVDIRRLQARLAECGLLEASVPHRRLGEAAIDRETLARLAEGLDGRLPLYHFSNMRMNETYEDEVVFAELCSAGPGAIPVLERAMEEAKGGRKLRLAQALAMLGSNEAAPVLQAEIRRMLDEASGLPKRRDDFMYVQLPPDHGAMPDMAYLLHALALTADPGSVPIWEEVVRRLDTSEPAFKDMLQGTFYYVQAVCSGAERLGSRLAAPLLEELHAAKALNGLVCGSGLQPDYFEERRALLELMIGRALARCGSETGYRVLIAYLRDARALLAEHAEAELAAMTGERLGKDPAAWSDWLERSVSGGPLPVRPYRGRLDRTEDSGQLLRRQSFDGKQR